MSLLDLAAESTEPAAAPEQRTPGKLADILATVSVGAPEGQRNVALTRLGGLLRSAGLHGDMIEGLLSAVNTARSVGLPEAEVRDIARSVGRYRPSSESRLPKPDDVLTVAEARAAWERQRATAQHCRTGLSILDKCIPCFMPGEVFIVGGRSGTCKTTLGLTLGRGIAEDLAGRCLVASLEMNAESVWYRLGAMQAGTLGESLDGAELSARLAEKTFAATVAARNDRLLIVDRDSQTVAQVEEHLTNARERFGAVPVLVIDYLGYLSDPATGSTYERVSRIARGVKALSKRARVRVILLCQTSRAGEDGSEPVKLQHLRDSGAIEESGDYILGLWKSRDNADRLHAEILKNRHGRAGVRFDFINTNLHLTADEYRADSSKPTF
jgi:replicative DNA helicase